MMLGRRNLKRGDVVVFRKDKRGTHPGPRAKDIYPATKGDQYSYHVDKFWLVLDVRGDGKLVLQTRRGKTHLIDSDDPHLRAATLWDRLWYSSRFPRINEELADKGHQVH